MAEEVIEAVSLKYNTSDAQAEIERLENALGSLEQANFDLKDRQKELQQELKQTGKFSQEQAKEYATNRVKIQELNKSIRDNSKDYKAQRAILAENASGVKGLNDLLTRDIKTRGEAKKIYSQLVQAQDQMNFTTEEGEKHMQAITERMEEVNEVIKKNSDSTQLGKLEVGQYSEVI